MRYWQHDVLLIKVNLVVITGVLHVLEPFGLHDDPGQTLKHLHAVCEEEMNHWLGGLEGGEEGPYQLADIVEKLHLGFGLLFLVGLQRIKDSFEPVCL